MRIVLCMTAVTACRRIAEFLSFGVALFARDSSVGTRQSEIRRVVIERVTIEPDDVRPSPRMLGVTASALRVNGGASSVKPTTVLDISANIVMTVEAQSAFALLAERLVTLSAILLDGDVCSGYRPRHDERFQRYRPCKGRGRQERFDAHRHRDRHSESHVMQPRDP